MRLSTSALALGAATAVAGLDQQHVLGGDGFESIKVAGESWMNVFEEKFHDITSEAKAVWDEITLLAPEAVEAFKKSAKLSQPKPHVRKPDAAWDHVVKGAEIHDLWVEKEAGEKHRQYSGHLENYNLRAKKVDPSKLGIDKVKQYSGYLDDEENDKHLFYSRASARPWTTLFPAASNSSTTATNPAVFGRACLPASTATTPSSALTSAPARTSTTSAASARTAATSATPPSGWISEYLNQDHVIEALGAEVSNYESCNFDINRNFLFAGDWFQPFHRLVPGLLEKIPVLIYAGDADYICNWLGNRAWTEALEWPGQKGFNKADIKSLTVADDKKGKEYGKVKSSGNFTFMQIYGAGHMVPMDQPESSSDFFNRWLSGEWND
ncbi:carboxypeptidase Y [Verticillium dahliae VdLs.17]|uniref:Carboxypeptidase Y homolog A n=1 Tax=Verticillium dahliae (strain VdLs.17 / ATCC MYA-4575 / FGSC 10137) TaxID=498257 RepID=G2X6H6_VERDV|nr:carboxypeptidase Y [Verticillium dahliae VdLs.17]EGY14594.1 carboxypeptidase Y [Verticillium dahliae VdLs.17]